MEEIVKYDEKFEAAEASQKDKVSATRCITLETIPYFFMTIIS